MNIITYGSKFMLAHADGEIIGKYILQKHQMGESKVEIKDGAVVVSKEIVSNGGQELEDGTFIITEASPLGRAVFLVEEGREISYYLPKTNKMVYGFIISLDNWDYEFEINHFQYDSTELIRNRIEYLKNKREQIKELQITQEKLKKEIQLIKMKMEEEVQLAKRKVEEERQLFEEKREEERKREAQRKREEERKKEEQRMREEQRKREEERKKQEEDEYKIGCLWGGMAIFIIIVISIAIIL